MGRPAGLGDQLLRALGELGPMPPAQAARELGVRVGDVKATMRALTRAKKAHTHEGLATLGPPPDTCTTCGSPIAGRKKGSRGQNRHCSDSCSLAVKNERDNDRRRQRRRARMRLKQGPCMLCGGPMQLGFRVRKTCSDRCGKALAYRRNKASNAGSATERVG